MTSQTVEALPTLAAVILAYGRSNRHAPLAEEVMRQGVLPANLIVVHNPDRLPDTASVAAPAGTELVRMGRNRGYAAGMNRGIASARKRPGVEHVLVLTHDVGLDDGALPALVAAAAAHPDYGALAPVLRQPTMRPNPSYGSRQWPDGEVAHITSAPPGSEVIDVPWLDGSVMLLRLAALDGSAPMPEGYFMYFEEAALCFSLWRRGWHVGSVAAAGAESVPGGSARPAAYGYLYARNGLDVMRREGDGPAFVRSQLRRVFRDVRRPGNLRSSVARLHGLVDQRRGRSGPPPGWIRRSSDITGV